MKVIRTALFISAVILLAASMVPAQSPARKVLILTGADPNHPGFSLVTQTIRSTMRDPKLGRVEFLYELQSGFTNPGSAQDDAKLLAYLKEKYQHTKIDLLLPLVAPRLKDILKGDPSLFADTPKIFYEFDYEREGVLRALGAHGTGIWASVELSRTLDLALTLQPDTKRVIVVSGNSEQERRLFNQARIELAPYESRLQFTYLTDVTLQELKDQLASLPPQCVVMYLIFNTDKAGNVYPGPEALELIAPTSKAPIFGISDTYMGHGIVGGSLLDFQVLGRTIGEFGQRILLGERAETIPSQTVTTVTTVDWRELRRFGMEQRLPPNSVVRFKEPTLWELYKWYIIALVAAIIIEALLIAWLLLLRVQRRRAEVENERLALVAEAERKELDEVVSNVPGLVWETRIESPGYLGKTTFISDHVETMLGYTAAEWMSKPAGFGLTLIPDKQDRDRASRDYANVIESGRPGFTEFRWQAKDGHIVWVESHVSPILDQERKVIGLRGVTLDVSERKFTEGKLRETRQRNDAIVRAIPDLIFLHTADGVYVDYHCKDPKDLLLPPDQFLGKNFRDVLPPDLAGEIAKCFEHAKDGGEPQILDYDLELEGKEKWFEARIVRAGDKLLSVVRNITQRKLDEIAIKASEHNYRSIFNAANDAIFVHDMHTGEFLDANQRVCEMYGYTVNELRRLNIADISSNEPPYTQNDALGWIQKAAAEPQLFEWRARNKDGRLFWVEVGLKHAVLGNQDRLLAVVRDITERKHTMTELHASEARFAKAFRSNPSPMTITTVAEGRYIDVNDSFLAMSGYTREEIIGHTALELEAWDSPSTRANFLERLKREGSLLSVELNFHTKHAKTRTLLVSAEFVEIDGENCLLITSSDITERKRVMNELRASEERFGKAFRANPQPMSLTTIADGRYVDVNDSFLAMSGYSREEVIGHTSIELGVWGTTDTRTEFIERLKREGSIVNEETAFYGKNGRTRTLLSSAELVEIAGEDCLLMASSDITDRKESEAALLEAHKELVTAHEEVSRLKNQLQEENIYLKEEISLGQDFDEIVGQSDALKYVLFKIEQVAPTETTVLITGETGTGKELVARAIHSSSARGNRPLVRVNCGALSPTLIESELFGHEKGAFTGASARKIGRFELANGGTIFLDEIGELPPELQVKLLRVIQEGELERLGSSKTINIDVRIIAATNRHLETAVRKGAFREDLWYRLNVFPITVPPLRQRREDIKPLVEHFARKFSKKLGKVITSVSPATLNNLISYSWPGNVRELANVIERATITATGSVLRISDDFGKLDGESIPNNQTLEEMERDYIIRILTDTNWRIEGRHGAARVLGMNPSTLRTRMARLGIERPGQSFTQSAN